ncbi:uncharacterized protein LOC134818470 [Bolinopsis microptera]|uniref:uncharacterized protein LOC134818470 n=1 Tax=Bolinopsis microptera TaxID=2820187 RepID=UPI00307A1BCD
MYPGSPTPKKTLVGLPVRNIDYGSLHKSLRVTDRDVKRNLQPQFLESLGKMCLSSSVRSEGGLIAEGNHGNAISHSDNGVRDVKERAHSPLLNVSISSPNALNNSGLSHHANCSPTNYCGICRKKREEMTHYGIYHQDDSVDMVMGGVIDRIDHLIDRLGKGGYDRKEFGSGNKENNKKENVGIILPCEACTIRAQKRYAHASCQTEEPAIDEHDLEVEDIEHEGNHSIDEAKIIELNESAELAPLPTENSKLSPPKRVKKSSSSPNVKKSNGVYTDVDDDNLSVLSSDDEDFSMELETAAHEDDMPPEVREYEIASTLRREMPEVGSTETVHFKMLPYRNLYVMGQKKFIGCLPSRIALRSNYELNYHITVFKTLSSDRPDIRMKRLKELVSNRNKTSPSRKGPMSRTLDSSKLGNLLVVDIPRFSREAKRRSGGDIRIPVINLRDGHSNKLWLSERVSALLMSRSPRLRFAIEIAKSNRAHWKLAAKDLMSNQRPFKYSCLYGGKSYTQFYLNEMKRFVTKPLLSKCLCYYVDIYEDNNKDHVKSKTFVGCLGNMAAKDSKSTPLMHFEERIKEHVRSGQKLHDPKVNIFSVALQNPILSLDEPGRFLPQKGSQEITKCPNLLFVPLDFGFSSWSRPTTQDHLSALKQAYCDVFSSNGPAGYNV